MQVIDVMASGQIKERASVLQSKTQKSVRFEISEGTRASVAKWLEDTLMVGSEYLWPGRIHECLHISTRQYARIVRHCVILIGLEATAYGTHSMRRTKGECPIFCVSVIWFMLPERSKDDDDFQGITGRTAEGLRAA